MTRPDLSGLTVEERARFDEIRARDNPGHPQWVDAGSVRRHPPTLTARRLQVLAGCAEGKTDAEIGADLGLSSETVKAHVSRILRFFDARSRAHAVALAYQTGVLTIEGSEAA